jgi:phosphonopyruvate decarboxylase
MIVAERFIEAARQHGFGLYTGVPCSYLKPFINTVIDSSQLHYIGAANEGDAVAIAVGAELGSVRSVVMFQNSGLGNAVSPLTSLSYIFKIPLLLIVTLRGEPGGPADEPQHELMGEITTEVLELMRIPWEFFPQSADEVEPVLARATAHMEQESRPYALVMRKGSVTKSDLQAQPDIHPLESHPESAAARRHAARSTGGNEERRCAGGHDRIHRTRAFCERRSAESVLYGWLHGLRGKRRPGTRSCPAQSQDRRAGRGWRRTDAFGRVGDGGL